MAHRVPALPYEQVSIQPGWKGETIRHAECGVNASRKSIKPSGMARRELLPAMDKRAPEAAAILDDLDSNYELDIAARALYF